MELVLRGIQQMKTKSGKFAIEILILMIVVVLTSSIIFLLIQADVIAVKESNSDVSLLNMEFIPIAREGYLSINELIFCDYIDENYGCIGKSDDFALGNKVNFRFVVESSAYNGEIKIIKNYRIKGPSGNVFLDVDESNNFHFDLDSDKKTEFVTFKDYFFIGKDLPEGEYTLELIVENPLIMKKTTLSKKFQMYFFDDDGFLEPLEEDDYYD